MSVLAFRYRAARPDGRIATGTLDSSSRGEVGRKLIEQGMHPISVEPVMGSARRQRPASTRELAAVFQGLASLVGAGVPVLRALEAIGPIAGAKVHEALARVGGFVREGRSLGEAFDLLDGIVPGVVVGIVRAGERSSQLAAALDEAAEHLTLEADLGARVRQALAYPLLLLAAGLASTGVIVTVVIPRFAAILGDLGQQLPASTRFLLAVSGFLGHWWWSLLLVAVACVAAMVHVSRDPQTRIRAAELVLGVPLLGELRLALATARSARAAASALAAGVPLLSALAAAGEAAGDPGIRQRLARVAVDVSEGGALAPAMERHHAMLPSARQLVAVGEASGQLAAMMRRAGTIAGTEAERRLRTLIGLLEPGLVVLFGGLVAFVAAALLQAVYALRP